jgi:flagellar motor switch protein FliN
MSNTPHMTANDIEQLMSREPTFYVRKGDTPAISPTVAEPAETPAAFDSGISPCDAEELLRQAELAVQSLHSSPNDPLPLGVSPFELKELQGGTVAAEAANLNLIRDVELNLKIELGRTEMSLDEVLKLRKGSVVALDRQAGEPVDVYANGRLIARGEVLVLDDSFCVRVVELTGGVKDAA